MNNLNTHTSAPLRGLLTHERSLSDLNTWHVGGFATQTYAPADLDDLCQFLKALPETELIVWLGLGSNVLIRDEGIKGTVILTYPGLSGLRRVGTQVYVEAGVTCAKLAKFCAKQGLAGGCFFAGIPGTLGGALAMNASAFGGETWPLVKHVWTVDRQGKRHQRAVEEFKVGYREVHKPAEEWFIAAQLQLTVAEDIEREAQKIRALIKERREKQPIGEPSCGSVFRNPPGGFAAQLIEQCGLKGYQQGGAIVSPKHANFIINTGTATGKEIEALILHVQAQVRAQTGVQLVPEVHFLGTQ